MSSQGPLIAGTGASDASFGAVAWTSPGNITANDATNATVTLGPSQSAQYLKATNFGFSIPAGATIDGIIVKWERAVTAGTAIDNRVRIVKGGAVGSTEKSTGAAWAPAIQLDSFGGAADLWGESWLYSDINASDFGAVIAGLESSGFAGCTLAVDYCEITIYYTVAATTVEGQLVVTAFAARSRVRARTVVSLPLDFVENFEPPIPYVSSARPRARPRHRPRCVISHPWITSAAGECYCPPGGAVVSQHKAVIVNQSSDYQGIAPTQRGAVIVRQGLGGAVVVSVCEC